MRYKILGLQRALIDGKSVDIGGLEQPANRSRLAFSILFNAVGFDAAMRYTGEFQEEVMNRCRPGHEISSDEIEEWYDFKRQPSEHLPRVLRTRRFLQPPKDNSTQMLAVQTG